MEAVAEDNDENKPLLTSTERKKDKNKLRSSSSPELHANEEESTPIDPVDNAKEEKIKLFSLPRRKKLIVFFLILCNFLVGCGFSLIAPFFPQVAEKKNVSDIVIGLIFSCFEFTIFISSPFYGNYLTRIGPRFMFLSGLLVAGSSSILFGTLDRCPPDISFIIVAFACRCIEALGFSAFLTAGFAIISSEFPKNVGTVFALLETADGIGLMVGPAVGGALYELGGYGLPFYVIGAITLSTCFIMIFLLPQPQEAPKERKTSVLSLFKSPLIWFASLSIAVTSLAIMFLDPTLSKHLEQFNLSPALIGLIFVIEPGLYAITSPFWGYLSDTKKINGPLIFCGNLMCALAYLLLGPSPYLPFLPESLWVIIVGLVISGLFIALAIVPTMNCLLIGATELGFEDNIDTYGIIAGLFNTVFCLGSFTGPMIGGVLVDTIGFRYGTTVISGLYLFATFTCAIYFITRYLKHRKDKASLHQSV